MNETLTQEQQVAPEGQSQGLETGMVASEGLIQQPEEELGTGFRPEELMDIVPDLQREAGSPSTYNVNNGIISIRDANGHLRSGVLNKRTRMLIDRDGLQRDEGMSVVLSNGPLSDDEYSWRNYKRIVFKGMVADLADRSTVKPENLDGATIGGDWLDASRIFVKDESNPEIRITNSDTSNKEHIPVRTAEAGMMISDEDFERGAQEVGHFGINNSIVAFMDGKGVKRVAPVTDERIRALQEAGYQSGSVSVPLSNGEKIIDEHGGRNAEAWQHMLEDAQKL